jgi:chaperonin cofactor prefoldin
MELEKFNQAKELQDKIETLETRYNTLRYVLKSACHIGVKIEYGSGVFGGKKEVYLKNINVRELIEKEINEISVEVEELKQEFQKL